MNNQNNQNELKSGIGPGAGGTCTPGDTKCVGDITYVCRDGHWASTGRYCQDDNPTSK